MANPAFYSKYLLTEKFNGEAIKGMQGASLPRISFEYFSTIKIPLPSITEQSEIIEMLEKETQIVNANKQLITIFEQKIKDRINAVWGVVD